ncbi:hypothetical protein BX600DRAFT_540158 [Xylariales sp. PMI_506]|nr:hypothetical protein BX600DRAFT_540158 [Xylariales sp. PMI_506]
MAFLEHETNPEQLSATYHPSMAKMAGEEETSCEYNPLDHQLTQWWNTLQRLKSPDEQRMSARQSESSSVATIHQSDIFTSKNKQMEHRQIKELNTFRTHDKHDLLSHADLVMLEREYRNTSDINDKKGIYHGMIYPSAGSEAVSDTSFDEDEEKDKDDSTIPVFPTSFNSGTSRSTPGKIPTKQNTTRITDNFDLLRRAARAMLETKNRNISDSNNDKVFDNGITYTISASAVYDTSSDDTTSEDDGEMDGYDNKITCVS